MIEYFSRTKKTELPIEQDFEKEFWYAIWEIQHLADESHEADGVVKRTLVDVLDYLTQKKNIPKNYEGRRP